MRAFWRGVVIVLGVCGLGFCLLWGLLLWGMLDYANTPQAKEAEKIALRELSQKLQGQSVHPIRLSYTHDGRGPTGVAPHIILYDPSRRSLQDWFELSRELALELANVEPGQIHQVAASGGSLNDLARLQGVQLVSEGPGRRQYQTPLRKPAPKAPASKSGLKSKPNPRRVRHHP